MIYIDDLIGTPYVENGRTPQGYDCYGLAIEVARRFGYKLNDVVYDNHNIELSDKTKPTLNITPVNKATAGTLIEMELNNALHIGICINEKEFIHATKTGCRINRIGTLKIRGLYGIDTRI